MRFLAVIFWLLIAVTAHAAPDRAALVRLDLAQSSISHEGRQWFWQKDRPRPLKLVLTLDQPVPYRVMLIDGPPRVVVDFRELDFAGHDPAGLPGAGLVPAIRWGQFRPGWSRMVIELGSTYELTEVIQRTQTQPVQLTLRLRPVPRADFKPDGNAMSALWDLPEPSASGAVRSRPHSRLRVVLDPGHGGIDAGAVVDGVTEADLMLTFARTLAESLTRAGISVTFTRQDDVFMGLEARMTAARAQGADLMISLHADALPEGGAAGAAIYVWDEGSDDRASRQLAARHDRADLLAGLDLQGTDDQIAGVLMQMVRTDTRPRSENIANFLAQQMAQAGMALHRRPVKGAAFSVLKAPDFPSVLVELGFLTDPNDRANLLDPAWRQNMADAMVRAIRGWARDDIARTPLLRQ